MRSKAVKIILVCVLCAVLVGATVAFSFFARPRDGVYESEYGTRYRIDGEELARLDVPTELSTGNGVKEFTVDVVYTYELYVSDFERRIETKISHIVYEGEDQAVKNLVSSFNRDVKSGDAESYTFATLSLKRSTVGAFERGMGTLRINGELLRRVKE